ncbi:MAG TPA: putative Ig domain-containing protein, partial [Gammaproteobacteria bacterium]|nr:putative Ig domain-containing protein [Gammaproteobacteria bacterium]
MTHRERCTRWWVISALGFLLGACTGDEEETAAATVANRAPVITGTPATSANQDTPYSFTPSATDADGDALLFGIDAKPAWLTFDTATGRLSGTPSSADVGTHRGIVVHVSDGEAQALLPAFDLTVVAAANRS